MFEAAELGREVSSADYKAQVPVLREELLDVQSQLLDAGKTSVIVLFSGVEGAGKSESVNLLNEWMDPRWLATRAYGLPSDEERERPEYWRFWRDLPPKGRIGFFLSAWYSHPLVDRVHREIRRAEFGARLDDIVEFERALTDDGALILKFWMHLDKRSQRERLEKLHKDPLTRWRVTREQWDNWRLYDRFIDAAETIITRTSLGNAPWMIVEGRDERYRGITIATAIRDAIRKRLNGTNAKQPAMVRGTRQQPAAKTTARSRATASRQTILSELDMSRLVEPKEYRTGLERLQGRLNRLHRRAQRRGVSTILVFEGWDAAGKGGAIRRLTAAIDARDYQVIPIAAPTEEERAQHYLWRFWRHLARRGRMTIFDRSWYGRLLVERVGGLRDRGRVDARLRRDQPVRGPARGARHRRREVLDSHHQRRAAAPLPRARAVAVQAMEADRRGLAEPEEVGRLRARRQRHDRAHQHAAVAMDARRSQRQELRAIEGAGDGVRPARGGDRVRRSRHASPPLLHTQLLCSQFRLNRETIRIRTPTSRAPTLNQFIGSCCST